MPKYLWQATRDATRTTIALGYVRVSKAEMKKDGLSVPAQHAAIKTYVSDQGWILGNSGLIYEDLQRGTKVDRDAYQAMLAEARRLVAQGTPVAIVVLRMDRFGRDRVERLRCWDELRESGIQIHAVREGGHQTDDLLEGFKALIANFEVQELSRRVSSVFDFMHRSGWYHVGKAPWGYVFRPATSDERMLQSPNSVLDLADPEIVELVREAWAMRARGDSLGKLSAWASALSEELRGGRTLDTVTMRTMFHNPAYIRRRQPVDGDQAAHPSLDRDDPLTWPKGRWPALIDEALWLEVQATNHTNRRLPTARTNKYALTSLLRCPRCSAPMSARPDRQWYVKKDGTVSTYEKYRYVCLAPQLGAGYDPKCNCTVSGRAIDEAVAKMIQELLDALAVDVSPRVRRQLVERSRQGGEKDQASQRVERLRKQRQQVEKVLAKASEKLALDEMRIEAYENLERAKLEEIRQIDAAIEQIRPKTPVPTPLRLPAESLLASVSGWASAFPSASPSVRRAMYGYLFEHVTPVIHGRADYTARVKWTPAGWAILNWAVELQRLAAPAAPATIVSVQGGKNAGAIFRSAKTGQAVNLPFDNLERDDR